MKTARQLKEIENYEIMQEFEKLYLTKGYHAIAGLDEAGRGPLAGPVAAAACILDPDKPIYGLNDSKKLSEKKRELLFDQIKEKSKAWKICLIEADEIDNINILQATKKAMRLSVAGLSVSPDFLLIDAVKLEDCNIPADSLIKGDARSVSIAAASVLAKVQRDRLMLEYDKLYPEYGFAKHKGYGTKAHYEALLKYGPCPIHRLSFLKNLADKKL